MSIGFPLTDEQLTAVSMTGRSILVSAAAGSGKTTVLAERCAYLVCDAPSQRCDVDQLLVLTFTEAAAAEMRARIIEAIRTRVEHNPTDLRFQGQLTLADAAQISTIHGFCLWMIRRWFDQAQIDPMATILDAEDASVLKREVLNELFEKRYAAAKTDGAPLGEDLLRVPSENPMTSTNFERLIDVYGLGQDRDIACFILKLYEFTTSLDDPTGWLDQAITNLTEGTDWVLEELLRELIAEIDLQIPHARSLAQAIEAGDPCGHDYARTLRNYADALADWKSMLERISTPSDALDQYCKCLQDFSFARVPQFRNPSDQQKEIRKVASKLTDQVKKLFSARIKERFGYFCSDEWLAGLQSIAPFVRTLVELVREFATTYSGRKKRLNVLDFSDLERLAFDLVKDRDGRSSPVASALRERFEHVLVDEFQDINPLQKAILEAVSRERDSSQPANLFAVGDVKQSIYRFRLAEPEIFLGRLMKFRCSNAQNDHESGMALFLQQNFRSRVEIIDAVNFLFRQLMSGKSDGLRYDRQAELRSGLPREKMASHVPVELHLLERRMSPKGQAYKKDEEENEENGDKSALPDALDRGLHCSEPPSRWDPIVREAYLAAAKIKEIVAGSKGGENSFRYSDIAILLRNTKITADRVAEVLGKMGIPAHAQVGGSLIGAREVRDLVAALQILDNFQQDIPLAGVLRSGIFGDRFTEDELVEIRLIDRDTPFHETVRQYARTGSDQQVGRRLENMLRRIQIYRDEVTRRPLAQTVWKLLEKQGYLANVAALPNAGQRQANLLKLYDLARKFSASRRQGLHRFLRLIESLDDEDRPIAVAPAGGAADNVVRIMSIHHAKGMEFPVVFLLGLGTKFNLGDRNGRMIFERKSKIGLRAIDTTRMLEYPTAVHQLVASEVERSTREEELRILYVALTRAKQRLILCGSIDNVDRFSNGLDGSLQCTPLRIATALTYLDWILPALSAAPDASMSGLGRSSKKPIIQVSLHLSPEMETWSLGSESDKNREELLQRVFRFESLPTDEPTNGHDEVDQTISRIHAVYPWLSASSIGATFAASAFRSTEQDQMDFASSKPRFPRPDFARSHDLDDAARRGSLTHRALEHLDFHNARDPNNIRAELDRMVAAQVFKDAEKSQILHDGIAWFVSTPLAEAIRLAPEYRREFRFVTTEPLSALDPAILAADDDRVLVRGIIDGILVRDAECEIIDFKTDAVTPSQARIKCETYRPQMEVYARTVERLWKRPVRLCRLVFLAAQCTVDLQPNGRQHSTAI